MAAVAPRKMPNHIPTYTVSACFVRQRLYDSCKFLLAETETFSSPGQPAGGQKNTKVKPEWLGTLLHTVSPGKLEGGIVALFSLYILPPEPTASRALPQISLFPPRNRGYFISLQYWRPFLGKAGTAVLSFIGT